MRRPVAVAAAAASLILAACVASPTPAVGDPDPDATATLQGMFDALKPGATLKLDRQTYEHGGVLVISVPNVHIDGNGATLLATNDPTSALQIRADGVSVSNLNLGAPIGGQRYSANEQDGIYIRGNGVTLNDVTVNGAAAAGVFLDDASNFTLNRVTVRDSRADGIHMTNGSGNGQVNNPLIERSGDDGVAVVSYSPEFNGVTSAPCHNIVVNSPVVNGTTWGQGVSALGGQNITYRNVNISATTGAGVYVGTVGAPFFSQSTSNVQVVGGTVNGANVNPDVVMGAVAVYGEHAGYTTSDVTISNLTINNTPDSAQRNIAVWIKDGGVVDRIALRNIAVNQQSQLPVVFSNAPRQSYTTSGLTLNGAPADAA